MDGIAVKLQCSQTRHMAGCNHHKVSAHALEKRKKQTKKKKEKRKKNKKTEAWHENTTTQTTGLSPTRCILVNCYFNLQLDTQSFQALLIFQPSFPTPLADMNQMADCELQYHPVALLQYCVGSGVWFISSPVSVLTAIPTADWD